MDSRSEPVLLLGVGGSESEGFDYIVCFVLFSLEKKAERH
jgi:hypothetical protein